MTAEIIPMDVSDRHAALGGTHHGRVVRLPVSPDSHELAPRPRPKIRFVMDRHQVRKVLEGDKTFHARLWHEDDPEEGHVHEGDRVPVQKLGAGVVCHVSIKSVDVLTLGEVGFDEAKAHGFKTPDAFRRAWLFSHDASWKKLGKDAIADKTEAEVAERWVDRWADLTVWVYEFVHDPLDGERYMAGGVITQNSAPEESDAGRGYTTNPDRSIDPDAPVVPHHVLETYAQDGADTHAERRRELTEEQLAARTQRDDNIVQRFVETVAIARALGVDPTRQIKLVGRALYNLEQAIRETTKQEREAA